MERYSLTGKIERETAKAVLFRQGGNSNDLEYIGGEIWWPKSQVGVYRRGLGPLDQLTVPEWLLAAKRDDQEEADDQADLIAMMEAGDF